MSRMTTGNLLRGRAIFCAAMLGIISRSLAQQPAERQPRPGDVDLANSRVFTFVGATGFGHEHAVEGRLVSGFVHFGANQSAGELVFDMKSFDADTPAARKYIGLEGESDDSTRKQVNDNMHGADVLDVAKFPTATFAIDSALPYTGAGADARGKYLLDGQFTMHGVKKHLRILAEADESNGMIHLRSKFSVLQSQFGITPFTKLLGTIGVADKMTIFGDAWIYRR